MVASLESRIEMGRRGFQALGLQGRILLTFVVLILYAFTVMGFVGARMSESFMVQEKVREVSLLYHLISVALSREKGLAEAILPFVRVKGVEAYILKDGEGRVVLKGGRESSLSILSTSWTKEGVDFPERSWLGLGERMVYIGRLEGGRGVYRLGMVLSLKDLREGLGSVGRITALYTLAYTLVIVLAGYLLLRRHVIGPVKELEAIARRITDGELEGGGKNVEAFTLPSCLMDREDEIGSLARSLERMRASLMEKIDALEKRNLEMARMQSQIVHAEKMASIGRLASAVAHEIGNPLGAILGYIEILQGEADDEKREILTRIRREIERMGETLHRLLDLSRPLKGEATDVDVNGVVSEVIDFMKAPLKGIEVRLHLSEGLPPVRIDPRGLEQVLINLILNARDAMAGGGRLTITTRMEEGYRPTIFSRRRRTDPPYLDFTDKRRLPPPLKGAKRWVKVVVEDTGCGMDEEVMGEIFNPFFTTKGPGKGTGLGLSISLGIVQAFGGDIEVKSEKGRGSTFEVLLPVW